MILKLVKDTDPILSQKCEAFNFDDPQVDPEELFKNLKDTMMHYRGLGLSACQVGIPLRVFVMGNYADENNIVPVFNPRITSFLDERKISIEEGCLSFPGLYIKILRPHAVRVRYANQEGKMDSFKFDGLTARVFQHEYDHLDGIVYTSKSHRINLERAKKKQKKMNKLKKKSKKSVKYAL